MTPQIHPDVLDDLGATYFREPRHVIEQTWQGAHHVWDHFIDDGFRLLPELPEFVVARALWVHHTFERIPEDKANYAFVMWQLLSPYMRKRS